MAGPLLAFEQGSRIVWVHDGCAAASSEVRVLDDAWFHVHAAISRGRRIQCAACGQKGATLGMYLGGVSPIVTMGDAPRCIKSGI